MSMQSLRPTPNCRRPSRSIGLDCRLAAAGPCQLHSGHRLTGSGQSLNRSTVAVALEQIDLLNTVLQSSECSADGNFSSLPQLLLQMPRRLPHLQRLAGRCKRPTSPRYAFSQLRRPQFRSIIALTAAGTDNPRLRLSSAKLHC